MSSTSAPHLPALAAAGQRPRERDFGAARAPPVLDKIPASLARDASRQSIATNVVDHEQDGAEDQQKSAPVVGRGPSSDPRKQVAGIDSLQHRASRTELANFDLRVVERNTELVKRRQDELESACLAQIKEAERNAAERAAHLKRQLDTLDAFLKDEIQSKLRNLADESARSKRFVTREVESLTEELLALKQGLLTADPWNNRARFYQLEERVKSLLAGRGAIDPIEGSGAAEVLSSPSGRRSTRPGSANKASSVDIVNSNIGILVSPRQRKAESQRIQDLIEDAVNRVDESAERRVQGIETEARRRELEMMAKYQELLDRFTAAKLEPTTSTANRRTATEVLNEAAAERAAGTGEQLIAQHDVNRRTFLQMQEELVALRAFVLTSKQEEQAGMYQMKQAIEEEIQAREKDKKKELADLWREKNALTVEVQKMAEKMQESLLFLASAAKQKEEGVKNQVLDQCYSMQTMHQNEFRVVMRKMEDLRKEETTDKHSLLAEIERALSMVNSLSTYAADVNNRLQQARGDLAKRVEQTEEKLLTRNREHEQMIKSWVGEKVTDVDTRLSELLQRAELATSVVSKLETSVEKGNLSWVERFRALEHTTESKCNGLERHTDKKMQILEFEVRSATNTAMLDLEEKVNKNLTVQEKNNRSFRKLVTQELIDKTRSLFTRGITETENKLMLKLEENRGRIEQVNLDLTDLLRQRMLDLQERIHRQGDEQSQALARVSVSLSDKIERTENDLWNKCDALSNITADLRALIEDTERKVLDESKTFTLDVKDELENRISLEKQAVLQEIDRLLGEERRDRLKADAERLFGLQKRLTAFEGHVEQTLEKTLADVDERGGKLQELVQKIDTKHEDFQKQNEDKEYQLGEGIMELLKIRELDQEDLRKRFDLVMEHVRKRCDELGLRLFEGDEKLNETFTTRADKTDQTVEVRKVETAAELGSTRQELLERIESSQSTLAESVQVLKDELEAERVAKQALEKKVTALEARLVEDADTKNKELEDKVGKVEAKADERIAAVEAKADERIAEVKAQSAEATEAAQREAKEALEALRVEMREQVEAVSKGLEAENAARTEQMQKFAAAATAMALDSSPQQTTEAEASKEAASLPVAPNNNDENGGAAEEEAEAAEQGDVNIVAGEGAEPVEGEGGVDYSEEAAEGGE
ncbi:unnamed protein product [Amoebophrya sp. A25]|nr:unnamed protein product [Amoebophrya sp. A25]|eukprot:GSA25T00014521001.1